MLDGTIHAQTARVAASPRPPKPVARGAHCGLAVVRAHGPLTDRSARRPSRGEEEIVVSDRGVPCGYTRIATLALTNLRHDVGVDQVRSSIDVKPRIMAPLEVDPFEWRRRQQRLEALLGLLSKAIPKKFARLDPTRGVGQS